MEDIKVNRKVTEPKKPIRVNKHEESIEEPEIPKITSDETQPKKKNIKPKRMSLSPRTHQRKPVRGGLKFLLIVSVLGGVVFWGGVLFNNAHVIITAKHQQVEYKSRAFIANKNFGNNYVDFEIVIETDKRQKDYILTESKEVSAKATGTITFFNEFSNKPVKLLQGTYIEDQDGKAYRLDNTVTIPGYKIEKQKKVPGQADINITSFLAGENYNGTPEKFYVSSFKGSTKYNQIYGKLKTELRGGLQGLVYYLTEEDKIKLKNIAESSFKDELYNKVKALLPSGYILYKDAIKFNYEIDENVLSNTAKAKIPIEGKMSAILLKENSLIKNILKYSLPDATQEEIPELYIEGLENLSFNFNDDFQITKDLKNFNFSLNGMIEIIWNPNKEILKNKLSGVHKDEVLPIFRQNRGIVKALVKIFPPWGKYLPDNPFKININIQRD
jgi:hypothetical protein